MGKLMANSLIREINRYVTYLILPSLTVLDGYLLFKSDSIPFFLICFICLAGLGCGVAVYRYLKTKKETEEIGRTEEYAYYKVLTVVVDLCILMAISPRYFLGYLFISASVLLLKHFIFDPCNCFLKNKKANKETKENKEEKQD